VSSLVRHAARTAFAAVLLLPLAVPLEAQRPARGTRPISTPGPATARIARLLSALADDSLEGRDTGSRGSAAAARIIAAQLREASVQPAGDAGYFQRVPITRLTPRPLRRATRAATRVQQRPILILHADFASYDTVAPANHLPTPPGNVVGVLPGRDRRLRDEAVVVSAHYDHIGIGQPVNGDSIYNGADDDASGTVAVLEIARLLGRERLAPRRTVIFLFATGEEVGALGTTWYVAHPVVPLEHTVANLNIEMVARPDSLAGGPGIAWLTGFERSTMGVTLREAGIPIVPDPRPEQNFFERSDNIAFARRGIPAHTLSSFNLHADYHTPDDEADRADPAHMAQVIAAAARAVRLLADGPAPRWATGGRPGEQTPRRPVGALTAAAPTGAPVLCPRAPVPPCPLSPRIPPPG